MNQRDTSIVQWIGLAIGRLIGGLHAYSSAARHGSQRNPDRVMLTLRPDVTRRKASPVSASPQIVSLHLASPPAPLRTDGTAPPLNSTVRWPWHPQARLSLDRATREQTL